MYNQRINYANFKKIIVQVIVSQCSCQEIFEIENYTCLEPERLLDDCFESSRLAS